ncbi:DNA-processing protein DprA [Verrucomicrobium sp. BvORR034]|uniref:DNA-processing protein DprA n=1 Tax=Verrucomicrobium sp. BvORR034 TaxID=1396418 RepID=UPI0007C84826|nr:DNA-processing protein DprA [Verrucomicrobium sp. BvORR034]
MTISEQTRKLLELSMLKGVGPAALRKIASIGEFWTEPLHYVAATIPQVARALADESAWSSAQFAAEKQIREACTYGARILSRCDNEYPQLLRATHDDPCVIYVQGRFSPSPCDCAAIIGTREPTAHGELITERIAHFFVDQGWSVVSGLAIGCDAVAHKATISAGGHTVAVMAHGLHMIAPSRHKKLAEEILSSNGALVSEYPFGRNVQNQQYVKRDRTQAGLARGVVMIQSDVKGGSLHASRAALDYGRWLAVPYPTSKDRDKGEPKVQANLLIADGNDQQRIELLRCSLDDLSSVLILRGRADYFGMLGTGNAKFQINDPVSTEMADPRSAIQESTEPKLTDKDIPESPIQTTIPDSRILIAETSSDSREEYSLVNDLDVSCEDLANSILTAADRTDAALRDSTRGPSILERLEYIDEAVRLLCKLNATPPPSPKLPARQHFAVENLISQMLRTARSLNAHDITVGDAPMLSQNFDQLNKTFRNRSIPPEIQKTLGKVRIVDILKSLCDSRHPLHSLASKDAQSIPLSMLTLLFNHLVLAAIQPEAPNPEHIQAIGGS